ncbi:vesicle transport v-snare protein vti1 [Coprinopsis marcescibilis]|uniref:Vesicle transport v-snare protein vti1 n=1 Tax=Coprinopsis marcescibilis TaxID=230819 RepID=A0A5C3L882_COPMA|nr:vesicle transport v-snare protein vti1 [Coprinopsis marcescibilis]
MDTSPTALFESYEQEFKQLVEVIDGRLASIIDQDDIKADDRKSSLRRVEMELEEADEMVSQMDLELQSIPQPTRPKYQIRLKEAKNNLLRCKKSLTSARAAVARSDLLASKAGSFTPSDDPYGSSSDRSRLLAGVSTLENGSKRLEESQRLAIETENQGAEILRDLRSQREQIENSRDTLHRADVVIDKASSTLKQMVRRWF